MTQDHPSPASRLPGEPAYWNHLARRIVEQAGPTLSAYRSAARAWWAPLARRSPWLAAAAVLITATGWLFLPGAQGSARGGADLDWVLTPADPLARSVLTPDGPPPLDQLLGQGLGVEP
jgi:hypothetical protein